MDQQLLDRIYIAMGKAIQDDRPGSAEVSIDDLKTLVTLAKQAPPPPPQTVRLPPLPQMMGLEEMISQAAANDLKTDIERDLFRGQKDLSPSSTPPTMITTTYVNGKKQTYTLKLKKIKKGGVHTEVSVKSQKKAKR